MLNITFHSLPKENVAMYINDREVELKRIDGVFKAEADVSGEYTLKLVKVPELSKSHWFLHCLFFWLIGFFGFFTPRYDKRGIKLDYSLTGFASENSLLDITLITSSRSSSMNKAVLVKSDGIDVCEKGAYYLVDETAVKRRKRYTFLSWLVRILIVAGMVLLITSI